MSSPQIDSFDDVQCEDVYRDGESFVDHDGTVWDVLLNGPADNGPYYVTRDEFGELVMMFDAKDIDFIAKVYYDHEYRVGGYYGLFLDLLLAGF